MNLKIVPQAKKQIRKLPKTFQIITGKRIRELGLGNFSGSKKLASYKDVFRVRIGNYRIVYMFRSNTVYILLVRHRKDAYRKLGEYLKHFR